MANELTKDFVTSLFASKFGQPTKALSKITGWHVREGMDIVVQLDSRKSADLVYIWFPAIEREMTPIDCPCDLYAAGKTRHHNVATFRSVAIDRWAIRFRPTTARELISMLKALVKLSEIQKTRADKK